jgi:three-Cys-motif partner protein
VTNSSEMESQGRSSSLWDVLVSPEFPSFHDEVLELVQSDLPAIASDGLPARLTGVWVHDKNFYVERYLSIFSRGVSNKWAGKISYLDLFAGPGRNIIRNTQEEVEGSPLLALKFNFARYVFVDIPEVLSTLRSRLVSHPKFSQISFVEGDCNAVIDEVLTALPPNYLTLAFIDPTGLQIRFSTIRRLVDNRKVDLLMTIQFGMGIRMNLPLYTKAEGEALSSFLGNSDWREDVNEGGSSSQVGRRILDRYLTRLRGLNYRTVQDREMDIRSDQNNLLLYIVVLASRHPLGEKFWREATKILPSGQRRLNLPLEERG